MKQDRMGPFLKEGKSVLLAYDQGLEHGPSVDFDDRNVDPRFVMELAAKGKFNGVVFQKGVAERFYDGRLPLIVKLNGKTSLPKGEPVSRQVCSVDHAISIGAKGVGYTIYLGSGFESEMFSEFGRIQEQAHQRGIAAIAWIYPRGGAVANDSTKEVVAYAARAGLELGADAVKIKYTGDPDSFSWAVRSAAGMKVFMSGGPKAPTDDAFLEQVRGVMKGGGTGVAVGRNVWQNAHPAAMAEKVRAAVFGS
ncbi:MAG: aldolase [Thaumarchaeota archaeon]|nr:aldolase [Nitrososphaerota archaeon]